jgi:DNA-binding FadR family transcriptional regulator
MNKLERPAIKLQRPKNLSVQLARDLAERITRGELRPGDKLPSEHELVATYSVSRTVVREAIASLKADGLVSSQQGVGVFVMQTSRATPFRIDQHDLDKVKEVISLLELRISIEAEAAALAAMRGNAQHFSKMAAALERMASSIEAEEDATDADFQFHMEIALATGNHYFSDFFSYLGTMAIPRARINTYKADAEARRLYLQNINREHQSILHAISSRDPEAARASMRLHLVNSRERLKSAFENSPGA